MSATPRSLKTVAETGVTLRPDKTDLTAVEAAAAVRQISTRAGTQYSAIVYLADSSEKDAPLRFSLSRSPGYQTVFSVTASTWRELIGQADAKWSEIAEEIERRTVREMALEIIRLTADQGRCTDAALRGCKFSHDEVARLGHRACDEATTLAAAGPFRIVPAALSNGAPALEAA